MKKLAIFTLIAMLLVSLTVPFSSAADPIVSKDVLKGTPVVDGKIDDLYRISAQAVLEEKNFWGWVIDGTDMDATIYYLYDDTNLYYAADVYDTTTVTSSIDDDWRNDGIEMRFKVGEVYFKVVTNLGGFKDGFIITDGKDEEGDKIDISKLDLKSTVKADGTGYILEIALPLASIGLKADKGTEFAAVLQLNDIIAEDREAGGYASGGFRVFEARKGIQNHTYKFTGNASNPNKVLKHTPVLDGKIDDAYLKSSSGTIRDNDIWAWGGADRSTSTMTGYFLWDDNYLYLAMDVNDATVFTDNDDGTFSGNADNPWMNDSIEVWFHDSGLLYKIHCSAGGLFFVGTDKDGMASFDFSKAILKTSVKDGGYILEAAFPFVGLEAGRAIVVGFQLNDVYDAKREQGDALGGNADEAVDELGLAAATFVCSAELAEPAPVTEAPAPVTEAPAPGGNTTPAPSGNTTPVAPATLDAGVIVAAVALVSLAGIVVAKKKH